MVHEVIPEVDMGIPIIVREIPLNDGVCRDLHSLEQHIHNVEWEAVVQAIATTGEQLRN